MFGSGSWNMFNKMDGIKTTEFSHTCRLSSQLAWMRGHGPDKRPESRPGFVVVPL